MDQSPNKDLLWQADHDLLRETALMINLHVKSCDVDKADTERRMRRIERLISYGIGGLIVINALGGGTLLIHILGGK